jgi:hypothetical protein
MQLAESNFLIHPVEARGRKSELECSVLQDGGLQGALDYLDGALLEGGVQIGSQAGIRFDGDDRRSGLEQTPGHQTSSRSDLEYPAPARKPTPLLEGFIDSLGILRATSLVQAGVASEETTTLFSLEHLWWL